MSLGVSVDVAKAAVDSARIVIVQVNPRMFRAHWDGLLHESRIDRFIEVDSEVPEPKLVEPAPEYLRIGALDNSQKRAHAEKSVSGFVVGS